MNRLAHTVALFTVNANAVDCYYTKIVLSIGIYV